MAPRVAEEQEVDTFVAFIVGGHLNSLQNAVCVAANDAVHKLLVEAVVSAGANEAARVHYGLLQLGPVQAIRTSRACMATRQSLERVSDKTALTDSLVRASGDGEGEGKGKDEDSWPT